jgi:hypothetical protein
MQRCNMHLLLYLHWTTCFVLLLTCQSAPLQSDTLTLGSTISTTTLVSPGGVFEVGFTSNNNLSTPVSTLAIWYANAGAKAVVWVAPNRALALSNASLSLSTLGDLQVFDNSGKLAWHSDTANVRAPLNNPLRV